MAEDPISKLVDPLTQEELSKLVKFEKPVYVPRPKETKKEEVHEETSAPADLLSIFG